MALKWARPVILVTLCALQPLRADAFRAERIDGENTLTAIRPAPPCERFRQCD